MISGKHILSCLLLSLQVPSGSGSCNPGFVKCKNDGCVEDYKVCDSTDDCGDGTDEENCGRTLRIQQ